jgi:hypothetical protein
MKMHTVLPFKKDKNMGYSLSTRMYLQFASLVILLCLGAPAARADFMNGSFETGDFTGWTRSGFFDPNGSPDTGVPNFATFLAAQNSFPAFPDNNAVVTSQTAAFDGNGPAFSPAVFPTRGQFLAFISNQTSAGDGTLTGSSISQTFTLPSDASKLSFDVRLLNNDDPTFFAFANDFGGIALSQGSTILRQFNLDLDPTTTADAHVTANALAGGFFNSTPWISHSFDVSALDGQTVSFTAYSLNYGGDNFVETRLLLDNVQIQGAATAVPEPSGLVLFALGALGLAGTICPRRRQKTASIAR